MLFRSYKNGELLENQYCSLVHHAWNLVGDNVLENININDYFPNGFDENDLNDIHSNDLINNFISNNPTTKNEEVFDISQKEKKFIDQYVGDIVSSYNFDY